MELIKIEETAEQRIDDIRGLALKPVVKRLLSCAGGMIMMNPFVLGQLAPFSISLTCALKNSLSVWAAAGSIIGSFLFFDGTTAVKYITVILFAILIKFAVERITEHELNDIFIYINAFGSTLLIGSAIMLASGFSVEELLSVFFEAVIAAGGTYIFRKAAQAFWDSRKPFRYSTEETVSLLLTAGIILMHLYRYKLFQLSPVILIFIVGILICSRVKNGYGGALCGICAGFSFGLSRESGFICLGLAFGGLLCGELNRKSRIFGALGCFVPVFICAVADGSLSAYMTIAECIIACGIYLVLPEKFFSALCEKFNAPVPVYIRTDDNRKLARRLNEASGAISRVSDCVNTVHNTLQPAAEAQLNSDVRKTWNKVCSLCELNESCRPEVKNPTDETVERLAAALYNHAELDETRFPKGFFASCYSFTEMQSALQNKYLDFVANRNAQSRISQVQELMSDQFKGMADILHDIACEFDEEININSEAADQCADEAREFGLEVISTDSYLDSFGRLSVSLNIEPPDEDFNITGFTENLSAAIGTPLDIPELEQGDSSVILKFSQKLTFSVCVGAFSRSAEDGNICGDYYRSFCDENGRYIIILSDGMGTGCRAAVDSAMAAELFSRLVKAGLSFDSALSISNSALLVKSSDESLATLDVVCVDLYTGKTEFMKAGAAASFVRHRDNTAQLEQESLPAGILRGIKFTKAAAALEKGDIILMVSDGILGENNIWIQQELKLWDRDSGSPQELAEFIVDSACERRHIKHRDDMTAVAIYID